MDDNILKFKGKSSSNEEKPLLMLQCECEQCMFILYSDGTLYCPVCENYIDVDDLQKGGFFTSNFSA